MLLVKLPYSDLSSSASVDNLCCAGWSFCYRYILSFGHIPSRQPHACVTKLSLYYIINDHHWLFPTGCCDIRPYCHIGSKGGSSAAESLLFKGLSSHVICRQHAATICSLSRHMIVWRFYAWYCIRQQLQLKEEMGHGFSLWSRTCLDKANICFIWACTTSYGCYLSINCASRTEIKGSTEKLIKVWVWLVLSCYP